MEPVRERGFRQAHAQPLSISYPSRQKNRYRLRQHLLSSVRSFPSGVEELVVSSPQHSRCGPSLVLLSPSAKLIQSGRKEERQSSSQPPGSCRRGYISLAIFSQSMGGEHATMKLCRHRTAWFVSAGPRPMPLYRPVQRQGCEPLMPKKGAACSTLVRTFRRARPPDWPPPGFSLRCAITPGLNAAAGDQ